MSQVLSQLPIVFAYDFQCKAVRDSLYVRCNHSSNSIHLALKIFYKNTFEPSLSHSLINSVLEHEIGTKALGSLKTFGCEKEFFVPSILTIFSWLAW